MTTTTALVLLLGGFWLYQERQHFNTQQNETRRQQIENRHKEIKAMVDNAVDYINYTRMQTEERSRQILRQQVDVAYALAASLYERYHEKKPEEEIKELIREALRPLRFNEGRGYYFIDAMDGTSILFADRPEQEGQSLITEGDANSRRTFQDICAMLRRQSEGYHTYAWTKPGGGDQKFQKICYVKMFKPFDWFIGTGEYLEDIVEGNRQEVLRRLEHIQIHESTLFVMRWDGLSLLGGFKGQIIQNMPDAAGRKVLQDLIDLSRKGSGFKTYTLPALGGHKPIPRTGYIRGIAEWQWCVGSAIYVNDIEEACARAKAELDARERGNIIRILGLLCFVLLLEWLLVRRTLNRLDGSFKAFETFFERAAVAAVELDTNSLAYREFRDLAGSANTMLRERKTAEEALKKSQEQLGQAQKMEAIGQLAGGIAHDFNNLLTGILGHANLLRLNSEPGTSVCEDAEIIEKTAKRAAALTAQLLGFARRGKFLIQPVEISKAVGEVATLLSRTLEKNITIVQHLAASPIHVAGDPGQLQQAILNLALNARDAMAEGGELRLSTAMRTLANGDCQTCLDARPGCYALIAVEDTGCGIPGDILPRIFEPFFTTKEPGKGTGMGLAMVYGIVKNHGGFIDVQSAPGQGTRFTIFLPLAPDATQTSEAPPKTLTRLRRPGTILVIDDEEMVLHSIQKMLETLGCRVHAFNSGAQAIASYEALHSQIDLAIIDMAMPGLDGREVFLALQRINPRLKAMLSSGFALDGKVQRVIDEGMHGFIQKPYTLQELAEALARALDGNG